MNDNTINYILHLISKCDGYPAIKIPGAFNAGGQFVRLHDTYTHLPIIERSVYERTNVITTGNNVEKIIDDSDYDFIDSLGLSGETKNELLSILYDAEDVASNLKAAEDDFLNSVFHDKIVNNKGENNQNQNHKSDNVENRSIKPSKKEKQIEKEEYNQIINGEYTNNSLIRTCELYLSAPGGGKSTLLKMFALAYAYKYLELIKYDFLSEEFVELMIDGYNKKKGINEYVEDIEICKENIEGICDKLGVKKGVFPVFIEARDIIILDGYADFEDIIRQTINDTIHECDFNDQECEVINVEEIYQKEKEIILIIDSLEELIKTENKETFVTLLKNYIKKTEKNIIKVIMSSRYREYQDYEHGQEDFGKALLIPEKNQFVIKELFREFDIIDEFARKWYKSLRRINGIKKDDISSFTEPLKNNEQALNLITNPLELTGMLLISVSDKFLPSDLANLYGRSIELWINWTDWKHNYDDIMIQMSCIAYQMAKSENSRIIVCKNDLDEMIRDARKELQKYFKQEWSCDEKSIEEFRNFIAKSHIMIVSGDNYEFVHRQYQAFFVAYCIKNNLFPRKKRVLNRYEYIRKHVDNKEEFWSSIIILISTLDIDLRDEIIDELLKHALDKNDSPGYYISIIIQLASIPGINLDESELEDLYNIIVGDVMNWEYIKSKEQDILKILSIGSETENDIFLKVIINEYEKIKTNTLLVKEFKRIFVFCVFFCIWNCKVSDHYIKRILELFFKNFLNSLIMEEIYNASNNGTIQDRRVYNILRELGKKAIYREKDPGSEYFMLIAAIEGYSKEGASPYDIVVSMADSSDIEDQLIAANILGIAAWLIEIYKDKESGYSCELLNGKEEIVADFINSHIADKDNMFRKDYIVAYLDFYRSDRIDTFNKLLLDENTFNNCAQIAVDKWRRQNNENNKITNVLSYELEYVSTFPWSILISLKGYFEKDEINSFVEYLKNVVRNAEDNNDHITIIEGMKLLSLIDTNYADLMLIYYEHIMDLDIDIEIRSGIRGIDREGEKIFSSKMVEDRSRDIIKRLNDSSELITENLFPEIEGLYYYEEQKYEKAKECFLKQFDLVKGRSNLAYMLRRGEIKEVVYDGCEYDVPQLLHQGVKENESFSIINLALYKAYKNGVYYYEIGRKYLEEKKECDIFSSMKWWLGLNDVEGYIVTSWVLDINDFDFGNIYIDKIRSEFAEKVVFLQEDK